MSTPATPQVPAGWYPDPAGGPRSRWWDGAQWTEHYAEPYAPAAQQLTAPAGTNPYTVWIWLVVFLPYVTLPFLFSINPTAWIETTLTATTSQEVTSAALGMMAPWLAVSALSFVIVALVIFFAYRDWKELIARGVPQPFHWAFIFLNLVVGPVYAIGRGVVTARRTGRGSAVTWVSVVLLVVGFFASLIWAAVFMTQWMNFVVDYVPTTRY